MNRTVPTPSYELASFIYSLFRLFALVLAKHTLPSVGKLTDWRMTQRQAVNALLFISAFCLFGQQSAFATPVYDDFVPVSLSGTCDVPTGMGENFVSPNSVSIRFAANANHQYHLQWREQGAVSWPNATTLTLGFTGTFSHLLSTSLVEGTGYEWRIQATCPGVTTSDFSVPRSFTAQCSLITQLYTLYGFTSTSVQVGWGGQSSGLSYNVRWRVNNTAPWVGSATVSTNTYLITGLTNATTYEWQVQPVCSTSAVAWSSSSLFTTVCETPIAVPASGIGISSAVANWNYIGGGTQYELQWRRVGEANWTSVSSLTASPYSLTNLQAGTAYEYKVRKLCTDGAISPYSSAVSFTTLPCPAMVSLKTGLWTDPTVWSCNRIPNATDVVQITSGHVVTIPTNTTARAASVKQYGKLAFNSPNAVLQFGFTLSDGLVAHYPFNGNANDESGNANHGTVNGATLTTDRFGNSGKAYDFDGFSKISVADAPTLDLTGPLTFSVWAYQRGTGPRGHRMIDKISAGIGDGYWFDIQPGNPNGLRFGAGTTDPSIYIVGTSTIDHPLMNWTHLVVTFSQGTCRFYVDGVSAGSMSVPSVTAISTNSLPLLIGASQGAMSQQIEWFNGKLDDIRIYSRALSPAEVQQLYQLEAPVSLSAGLVAYYPFNGNANDESGNNRNGTVNGASLTTDRFGVVNKAYGFDGNQDYINIGALPTLSQFTISAWVRVASYDSSPCILSGIDGDVSYTNLELRVDKTENGKRVNIHVPHDGFWDNATSSSAVLQNTWQHITATWDGSVVRVFIDGQPDGSKSINKFTTSPTPYFIGGRPGYWYDTFNAWFNGKLDDIRIYNRVLNPVEVQQLYQLEAPVSLSAGLVAHYPFNGNANDESGNGRNGTVNGATLTTDRFGNTGKAYDFDGVSNRISAPTPYNQTMSVSLWFKAPYPTHTNGRWPMLISFGAEYVAIHSFGTQEPVYAGKYGMLGSFIVQSDGSPRRSVEYLQNVCDDTWYHVTSVYDLTNHIHKLYVDGVLRAQMEMPVFAPVFSALDLGISNWPSSGYNHPGYYKGKLDDIRIYNRTLNPAEVQALSNDR